MELVVASVEIQLSETMQAYIDGRVSSGGFADASDYVRELIRADEARLDWLRAEIALGDESGTSPFTMEELVEQAFENARRKCA